MKIMRMEEVIQRVQLSRTTIWRMERQGLFPSRIRIGAKAVGWLEEDIQLWLGKRPRGMTLTENLHR